MTECSSNILGLQDYQVLGVERIDDTEEEISVEVSVAGCCPKCQQTTDNVHQRVHRTSRILWSFVNGQRIYLKIHRRRLRCRSCRKVFTQPLPGVSRRQRMSVAAQVSMLRALSEQSFAALKRTHGIGYCTARRVLLRLPVPWCDWNTLLGSEGPISLGIDEHSFRGKDLVITISCLTTSKLVAILVNDRQVTLRKWLEGLPDEVRKRIVAVATDLKEAFRKVVYKVLPGVTVVADRFHVIQDANRRIEETRRLEQSEARRQLPRWPLVKGKEKLTEKQQGVLDYLKAEYPTLNEHHWLKESLRALYACPDLKAAEAHWGNLITNGESSDDASVVIWMRTLVNWKKEILGYFQFKITNGFTEGCHTKVKLLKRLSYGFRNIQVYRRKMLLGFKPSTADCLVSHLLT